MQWMDINQYRPGNAVFGDIIVRLSNGEKQMLNNRELNGIWLSRDGITKTHITHWMIIEEPK